MEVVVQHLPIQHKGDGRLTVLDLECQVGEGGRLSFGAQRHRKAAVRLHNGVGDIPWVKDVLAAQGLHQVGRRQPQSAQGVLVNLPIQNDRLGPAGHQIEKFLALEAEDRPQKLQRCNEEERDEAGGHGDFLRFDGNGRQIGDEDGRDQLFRLQLTQLALAHQPHGKQDAEIDQNGANDQELQGGTPPAGITGAAAGILLQKGDGTMQLSEHLETNLAALNARLGSSADFYAKRIELYHIRGAILLFDGMASLESLWELLLDAASRQTPPLRLGALPSGEQVYELLSRHSALPAESSPVENWDDLMQRLTAGMAVLLLDGSAKGLAFSVQSLKFRSVEEPSGEGDLRGSREGFSDLLRVNLSLLRRLIRTEALVMEVQQADCAMKTEYAVCYCKDKAPPAAVEQVKETLRRAKPQLLLDSSYFLPWLFPCRVRTASPVSYTERPAVASAKLCEGKIVVLVNGSPSAMVLPTLFGENFECLDDYAQPAFFASFLRLLKYGSFYLSIFLPGVFVCLAVYLPELLPPQLLFKIEAAERATPFPLFGEMVLVILLLEIIREAGLRMPQTLGHSVSLVAALIIGDAAIATGLLSTPVILIAAVASIAVFVVPSLYEMATAFRFLVLLAAGVAGPVGLVCAALVVLLALAQVSALGVPYCAPVRFPQTALSPDGVTRRTYRTLSAHPFSIWQKRR